MKTLGEMLETVLRSAVVDDRNTNRIDPNPAGLNYSFDEETNLLLIRIGSFEGTARGGTPSFQSGQRELDILSNVVNGLKKGDSKIAINYEMKPMFAQPVRHDMQRYAIHTAIDMGEIDPKKLEEAYARIVPHKAPRTLPAVAEHIVYGKPKSTTTDFGR